MPSCGIVSQRRGRQPDPDRAGELQHESRDGIGARLARGVLGDAPVDDVPNSRVRVDGAGRSVERRLRMKETMARASDSPVRLSAARRGGIALAPSGEPAPCCSRWRTVVEVRRGSAVAPRGAPHVWANPASVDNLSTHDMMLLSWQRRRCTLDSLVLAGKAMARLTHHSSRVS